MYVINDEVWGQMNDSILLVMFSMLLNVHALHMHDI